MVARRRMVDALQAVLPQRDMLHQGVCLCVKCPHAHRILILDQELLREVLLRRRMVLVQVRQHHTAVVTRLQLMETSRGLFLLHSRGHQPAYPVG